MNRSKFGQLTARVHIPQSGNVIELTTGCTGLSSEGRLIYRYKLDDTPFLVSNLTFKSPDEFVNPNPIKNYGHFTTAILKAIDGMNGASMDALGVQLFEYKGELDSTGYNTIVLAGIRLVTNMRNLS